VNDLPLVAGIVALNRSWHTEIGELTRRCNRERAQQDLVEERVDRGVGAYAEGEREDRDCRDKGCLEQHAGGEADVAHGRGRAG